MSECAHEITLPNHLKIRSRRVLYFPTFVAINNQVGGRYYFVTNIPEISRIFLRWRMLTREAEKKRVCCYLTTDNVVGGKLGKEKY